MKQLFMKQLSLRLGLLICMVSGLFCFSQTAYIHLKAELAQVLLEQAWHRSKAQGIGHRPWPWADVMPIAELSVPSLGIKQYVLNSHAGAALAFGPGLLNNQDETAPVTVLAGHRDTHFRFLEHLQPGTLVTLKTLDQHTITYQVQFNDVLNALTHDLPTSALQPTLFLVTCYPFNAITTHGPLRYVLTAHPVSNQTISKQAISKKS